MQSLAAGESLDHYEIVAALGQSAFSTAYEARDKRDGRLVVLKCPNPVILGNAESLDRFRREMAIGRLLKHPNIQEALDSGETRSSLYMVVEFIDGEDLRSRMSKSGQLETETAVDYTRQILSALDYAHAKRVYHRDLKPENMLVTNGNQLKIIDFGIAYMAGMRRLTWRWAGSRLGTPNYMSPEQIQGHRGDARSDIYALGAVLYEMLTGRPPFTGGDMLAVMDQHLKTTPRPPSRVNRRVLPGLDGIVLKALRKLPEERYQSAGAMAADLERYQELRLEDFRLGPEQELSPAYPDRLLAIVAAGLVLGFVAFSAAVVGLTYVFGHH